MTYDGKPLQSGSMPDRHLMVDIETLDVEPTAAVVALAAVVFDPRSTTDDNEFAVTISKRSNIDQGRSVSQSTLEWWNAQDLAAKAAVFNNPNQTDLRSAMVRFASWCNRLRPTCTRIWAKDPDFDVVILRETFKTLGIFWPFKFWEARSCRTAMEMAYPEGDFPMVEVDGPLHDPLVDCKKQVLEIQHAYHILKC